MLGHSVRNIIPNNRKSILRSRMNPLVVELTGPEFRLFDLLFPWIAVIGLLGFLAAWLVIAVMEYAGLSRYVWHLPLFFVALVILLSSLIGMEFFP